MLVSVPVPCSLVWGLFVVFTGLHLLANHRAVSVVCMETLNKNRCSSSAARSQVIFCTLTGCVFAGCTF